MGRFIPLWIKTLGFAGFLCLLTSSNAYAKPQWYVGASILGVDQFDVNSIEYDTGYGYSGKVGMVPTEEGFFKNTRLEGEYLFQKNDIKENHPSKTGTTEADAGLLNFYYDFNNNSAVIPYIGLGVGYADITLKAPSLGATHTNDKGIATQGLTGIVYAPHKTGHLRLNLAYRLFGVTKKLNVRQDNGDIDDGYYVTQSFEFGVHYKF